MSYVRSLREIGTGIVGRAVTDTLYVSPEGAGTNGKTWAGAFTTIQAALTAASTDRDECTLIMISPHTTSYDIDTTADPTWTGNYILKGSHRNWAKIVNTNSDNGGATSLMKFTGRVALIDLNFNLGTGNNGVIITLGGPRVYNCQFVGEDLTSAKTALHLDHASGGKHAKVIDCDFKGDDEFMTALKVDQFGYSNFERIRIHECLVGIHILGANADKNIFSYVDIGDCSHANGIGIDIDAGNEQHFHDIILHHNTTNVDDESKDHIWSNIFGAFPIAINPDSLTGDTVQTGTGTAYGSALTIFSTNELDYPFRIVGYVFVPSNNDTYQIRFSGDAGASYFDMLQFNDTRATASIAPSGTEFIFNAGTEIYCEARNDSGGDDCEVWVKIQAI